MKNRKLKARGILLDLDGTIVDSRDAYLEAARTAFEALGQETFDVELATEIPKRFEQNMPIGDLVTGVDVNRFQRIYLKAYYQATLTRTRPFPDVSDTLKKLSENAKLALTTKRNIPNKEVIRELEKFGLAKYFQSVITSLETRNPKPSPEALIKCSRRLGVEIRDCIVVGDSVVDIRAGKSAGAKTVAVLSGIFSREELEREKPDLILESVSRLPEFLE